jgi:hypothetical protein
MASPHFVEQHQSIYDFGFWIYDWVWWAFPIFNGLPRKPIINRQSEITNRPTALGGLPPGLW